MGVLPRVLIAGLASVALASPVIGQKADNQISPRSVQLQRPGEMHAVWVFWHGREREFRGWYLNLQEPFRRTPRGFDTQDLELDIVVDLDGGWRYKDDEILESWVDRGRWTRAQVAAIEREGAAIAAELGAGRRWWSDDWAAWEPDPAWRVPTLPADWYAEPAS